MKLIGSGASFPLSGAGIQDFTNRTVDFAGSDAAMTDEEIAKVTDGVVLLPVTAGEIVPASNLPRNPKDLMNGLT